MQLQLKIHDRQPKLRQPETDEGFFRFALIPDEPEPEAPVEVKKKAYLRGKSIAELRCLEEERKQLLLDFGDKSQHRRAMLLSLFNISVLSELDDGLIRIRTEREISTEVTEDDLKFRQPNIISNQISHKVNITENSYTSLVTYLASDHF